MTLAVAQKVQRRGDDLVARADAERDQRQVQRRGGGVDRDRVRRAGVLGEVLLEPEALGPNPIQPERSVSTTSAISSSSPMRGARTPGSPDAPGGPLHKQAWS